MSLCPRDDYPVVFNKRHESLVARLESKSDAQFSPRGVCAGVQVWCHRSEAGAGAISGGPCIENAYHGVLVCTVTFNFTHHTACCWCWCCVLQVSGELQTSHCASLCTMYLYFAFAVLAPPPPLFPRNLYVQDAPSKRKYRNPIGRCTEPARASVRKKKKKIRKRGVRKQNVRQPGMIWIYC